MHGRHAKIAALGALGLALAGLVVAPPAVGRGTIPASFDALRGRSSFTISDRVRLQNPPSCQMPGVTCSQQAFGTAQVVLKRLFLYRTKRSYAK